MGLVATIFNFFRPKRDPTLTTSKLIERLAGDFKKINNEKDNITFVSAINAHARHASKVSFKCFVNDELDTSRKAKKINYLLNYSPNPLQTASEFFQTIAKEYYSGNLCLIYIDYDFKTGIPKYLWVVDYTSPSFELREKDGNLVYKFIIDNKETYALADEIILLSRDVDVSKLFAPRSRALLQTLNVISTSYQGVEKAIKTAAFIRFLITSTTPLSDSQKKERAQYFADTFLGTADSSGVAYADNVATIQQVNTPPKYSNADEIQTFKNDIYDYLSITPAIIRGDYNEDQWQSYYETGPEVLFNLLQQKLTSTIYTESEICSGKYIGPISSRLQTASFKTRISIANAILRLPVIKPNTVMDLLYLPPLDNGDKEYSTLNFTEAGKMNQYQGVDDGKEETTDEEKNSDS